MSSKSLKNFDELFKDLNTFSPDKIENLVHESLKLFEYLRDKLQSTDPQEREKAMVLAQELQKKLEEQAEKALKETGMDRAQLEQFLASQSNFAPEEWNVLEKTQQELSAYQADLIKKSQIGGPQKPSDARPIRRSRIHKIQG
jgi:hypothetical protein